MILDDPTLFRLAGASAGVALVTMVISAVALALFFGGAGAVWGPVNDLFIAAALLALILPMLAIQRLAADHVGGWLEIVTAAAIGGAVLGAIGQVLLVIGVIDLNGSYVTGGIGVVPVLAWIVALIVLALPVGILPASIGWLAAAALSLILVASGLAAVSMGPATWITWGAVTVVLVAWLASLSASLLASASS